MEYAPDNWVVLEIDYEDETIYKVLGGWSGGYLDSDHWRLNSGITKVEDHETYWSFFGSSGSVYNVFKGAYRVSCAMTSPLVELQKYFGECVKVMDEETDWMSLI